MSPQKLSHAMQDLFRALWRLLKILAYIYKVDALSEIFALICDVDQNESTFIANYWCHFGYEAKVMMLWELQ